MYKLFPTTVLALLISLLPLTIAHGIPLVVSPGLNISTNPNVTAHLPPCTNLTSAPTIPCYTKLNVTGYLTNYNLTKAETCAPGQSWSTCLLTTIYQVAGANCTKVAIGVERCIAFDCSTLNSTTCVQPRPTNRTDVTLYDAQGWYAAWNIYSVHHHISAWGQALNAPCSEPAILSAINPRVANTATSVLKTLFAKYGINPNADGTIVKLLERQNKGHAEPAYGNARIRGESSTLSGTEWRGVLYARLEDALQGASEYDGFEQWLPLVEGGAYSTRGLSGVDALVKNLKKG